MRVLIVDDENSKVLRVKELLINKCGLKVEDIDLASNIIEAVGRMTKVVYDLLITDMCMPQIASDSLCLDGGFQLIDIIESDRRVLTPKNIIVLTASGCLEDYIQRDNVDFIMFDDSSIEWETKIMRKLW